MFDKSAAVADEAVRRLAASGRRPRWTCADSRSRIAEFTGVSAPYEPPPAPDLTIDTGTSSLDESVVTLFDFLSNRCR